MEELVSARIFFFLVQWCRQFFRAVHTFFFYSSLCCLTFFFLTVKTLQEIYFFHSPPQRSNGPPLSCHFSINITVSAQ